MQYSEIETFINQCLPISSDEIRWCDEQRFLNENMEHVGPGGFLNPYGYYVIGTTIGGNAIIINHHDNIVSFADHTWYNEDSISYQDIAGDNEWYYLSYSSANVKKSLFTIAYTYGDFIKMLNNGEIQKLINEID